METYDGCCGSCVHMNTNKWNPYSSKDYCYCTERRQYYNLHEPKCRYYEFDDYKDYYDLNHRWHVVSAIIEKLELKDSYECINVLHNYRKNFLEKDDKYRGMLMKYDIIGPVIAKCITDDVDSYELSKKLCREFLLDIFFMIREGKNEEALLKYEEMLGLLIRIYDNNINDYLEKKAIKIKK